MRIQEKKKLKYSLLFMLCLAMLSVFAVPSAFAALSDADAGDTISNTSSISFTVNANPQPVVNSNTATFVVDHKVRVVVTTLSGGVTVEPGSADEVLTFTVTNDGNTDSTGAGTTLDIQMTSEADAGDDFDMDSVRIYWDSNGNNAFDVLLDAEVTNATIGLARDTTVQVYLVANTPVTATDGQTAIHHLVATAWDSGNGNALAQDMDGDDPDVVEVVWADDAGSAPSGDGQYDGLHSASDTYSVDWVALGVVKSSTVISDPINLNVNPMRIPQAVVRYTIDVSNTGSVAADNIVLTDAIPTGTDFMLTPVTGGVAACSDDAAAPYTYDYTPFDAGNGADPNVTSIQVTLPGPIAGGGSATVTFEVIIE